MLANTSDVLSKTQKTTFRALSARANYLALDRPDIAYSAKELCRAFANPTTRDVERLKRLVRYLVHSPRIVYRVDHAESSNKLT